MNLKQPKKVRLIIRKAFYTPLLSIENRTKIDVCVSIGIPMIERGICTVSCLDLLIAPIARCTVSFSGLGIALLHIAVLFHALYKPHCVALPNTVPN
jgi:hypothetical protein